MTENGKYAEETAHLTERQKEIYHTIEFNLLAKQVSDEAFIDVMHAVEALSKTLRMSHAVWKYLNQK